MNDTKLFKCDAIKKKSSHTAKKAHLYTEREIYIKIMHIRAPSHNVNFQFQYHNYHLIFINIKFNIKIHNNKSKTQNNGQQTPERVIERKREE